VLRSISPGIANGSDTTILISRSTSHWPRSVLLLGRNSEIADDIGAYISAGSQAQALELRRFSRQLSRGSIGPTFLKDSLLFYASPSGSTENEGNVGKHRHDRNIVVRLGSYSVNFLMQLKGGKYLLAEVLQTPERERARPAVSPNQAAAPSPSSPATNATCPTISPLASHLTCPLRIMFSISMPWIVLAAHGNDRKP
jgi:hypothetical protein